MKPPPKYIGTVHPEVWLKQIQMHYDFKETACEKIILRSCKFNIDSSINIPDDIDTLDKLIKALKSHSTFIIFKDSCKRKLQAMKYVPDQEENYTASFLAKFRSLCYDAEINNSEKIKTYLMNSYLNEFFKNEFIESINGIESVDQIFRKFSDIDLKVIRNGSLITLKHVETGKYLSCYSKYHQTGSKSKVVFANKKFQNMDALWVIRSNTNETISYGDMIHLTHKVTGHSLFCHTTVQCNSDDSSKFYINANANQINNDTPYVKTKDVITLKSSNEYVLRSHKNFTFAIGDKTFQEVVGHHGSIDRNDEWQIELA